MDARMRALERAAKLGDPTAAAGLALALQRAGLLPFRIRYSHNNSGGYDWLDAADWAALEAEGLVRDGTYGAEKVFRAPTREQAIDLAEADWRRILPAQDPDAEGCPCCGRPHSFMEAWGR